VGGAKQPLLPLISWGIKLLDCLRLLDARVDDQGRVTAFTNLTLINLWLVWRGPLREHRLAWELAGVQAVSGAVGLVVRHRMAGLIFERDNL